MAALRERNAGSVPAILLEITKKAGYLPNMDSPQPQTLPQVRLRERIRAAGGANLKKAGEYFGWGPGNVTKGTSDFTAADLAFNGWTRERLLDVADAYEQIARITPSNPSAAGRAAQLRALAELHDEG